MLSNRALKISKTQNLLYYGWKRHHDDPYDARTNPNGIINLGIAENKLIGGEVLHKLSSVNYEGFDEAFTHYCCLTGVVEFREKLKIFFNKFMKTSMEVKSDDIFVMNGCGTVIETLGAAICDVNEGFLVPAPYYTTFKGDLEKRFNSKLYPIELSKNSERPFMLTPAKLQNSYNEALENGVRIKGLLISNPVNPLGITYSRDELELCLEFCYENNIHFVCDEIYMLSVYEKESSYISLLSLKNIAKYKNIIHVVWGFSKDFGVSGFRCGCAITFNKSMKEALEATAYYTSVPTATQYVLTSLITDVHWIEKLKAINHKRLKQCRDLVMEELTNAGISYLVPNSGLFLMFRVSDYMDKVTFDEEMNLFEKFINHGIVLVPGKHLAFNEPGWFRVVIANDMNALSLGLHRIAECLRC